MLHYIRINDLFPTLQSAFLKQQNAIVNVQFCSEIAKTSAFNGLDYTIKTIIQNLSTQHNIILLECLEDIEHKTFRFTFDESKLIYLYVDSDHEVNKLKFEFKLIHVFDIKNDKI